MRKMKKWLALGMAVTMLGASATCVSADETPKITFWDMVWGNEESIDIAKEMCAQYSEENGIEVEYVSVPWDNFYQTYLTAIASGEAPDCSSGSSYMPLQFHDMGEIYSLNDTIADMKETGEVDDYLMANLVEDYNYNGDYVCLPWAVDLRVIYARTDVLAENGLEVPTNWDEFRNCLEVLAKPDENKYGMILVGNGDNGKTLFQWLLNNGGGLFNENGEPDCVTDRNIETINYLLGLVNDGLVNPASAGLTHDDSKTAFAQGEVAFHLGAPGLVDQVPELEGKVQVMAPLKSPNGDQATVYWNAGLMVYSQSDCPEETADFIRWFVANMRSYAVDGKFSMFPTRNTVLADPAYAEDEITQSIVNECMPYMKTIAANSPTLFSALNAVEADGTLDAVVQSLFTPGITAEEILQTEQANLEMIMGM